MKDPVWKIERHNTEWEKIFVNHISDKGLVSRIYEELSKLNNKKPKTPMRKWAKVTKRHFTEEDKQMAIKHMENV